MTVKRTERGWGGHFSGCRDCLFRRNTLLERGDQRVVVSTVGNYFPSGRMAMADLDASGSQFETMVFVAKREHYYWEADTGRGELRFSSPGRLKDCKDDTQADSMHERVVEEIAALMESGRLQEPVREEYGD